MTDPKGQTGDTADTKAPDGVEDVTVIEVEPTRPAEETAESVAASQGLSLRTKLIGLVILVVLIAGVVAAALYPLWRDRAEALVATSGLPLNLPKVPDNAFYETVDDVVSFLNGAAPEPAPAPVDKVEAPTAVVSAPEPVADPLTLLAERPHSKPESRPLRRRMPRQWRLFPLSCSVWKIGWMRLRPGRLPRLPKAALRLLPSTRPCSI